MQIDSRTSALFSSQPAEKPKAGEQAGGASFAAIMAEKLQAVGGNSTSGPAASVEKYDFTNMTPKALQETVNSLISKGQLDLDDTTSLLGMMPGTALSKVNYDGTAPTGADTPMNVFSKIQSALEGALSRNETDSAAGLRRAAQALAKFQA